MQQTPDEHTGEEEAKKTEEEFCASEVGKKRQRKSPGAASRGPGAKENGGIGTLNPAGYGTF